MPMGALLATTLDCRTGLRRETYPLVSLRGLLMRSFHTRVLYRRTMGQRWSRRQASCLKNFLFVQRSLFHQGCDRSVERDAMLAEQALGVLMTLLDDTPDLNVNEIGRLVAIGFAAHEAAAWSTPTILSRCELDHAELVTHAPAGDHLAR